MTGPDGMLGDAERAKLRLLSLPVYAVSLALLARRPGPLIAALSRNVIFLAVCFLPGLSVLWSVALPAVFAPVALYAYRRRTSD